MPDWGAFAGFLAVLTTLLVLLARSSQRLLSGGDTRGRVGTTASEATGEASVTDRSLPLARGEVSGTVDAAETDPGSESVDTTETDPGSESVDATETDPGSESVDAAGTDPGSRETDSPGDDSQASPTPDLASPLVGDFQPSRGFRLADEPVPPSRPAWQSLVSPSGSIDFSTGELLANVALSHGLFGVLLLAAVVYTQVPMDTLGVAVPTPVQVGVGIAFGVVLWVLSESSARWLDVSGIERSEALREALAPDSPVGWLALYLVALPLVAGFEELLFRGALIGALSVGFEVSPWLLAVGSSVLFALGHGAQGQGGMLVTGFLGLVLAGGFIATGSLAVVLIAHYLVNALEFGVHELGPQLA